MGGSPVTLAMQNLVTDPRCVNCADPVGSVITGRSHCKCTCAGHTSLPIALSHVGDVTIGTRPNYSANYVTHSIQSALNGTTVDIRNHSTGARVSGFRTGATDVCHVSCVFSALVVMLIALAAVAAVDQLIGDRHDSLKLVETLNVSHDTLVFKCRVCTVVTALPDTLLNLFLKPTLLKQLFLSGRQFLFGLPR